MKSRPGQPITFDEVGKVSSVVSGFRTYSGAEGKPVAQRSAKSGTSGTVMTWLFSNLEGTVDVQTVANSTGTTTRMLRDPYGAPIGSSGVWGSGTGYMDKPVTASTGLTTVGARTYDAVLGKFLSVDPVIDTNLPQQNTGYTYSGNNPTTYMDPTGLRLTIGCEPYCGNAAKPKSGQTAPPSSWKPYQWKDSPSTLEWTKITRSTTTKGGFYSPLIAPTLPTTSKSNPKTVTLQQFLLASRGPISSDIVRGGQKGPKWGPLIGLSPNYKVPNPEAGFGVDVCVIICGGVEFGARGGNSWSLSIGGKLEAAVTVGASVQDPAPGYLFAGCSAEALVGASAQVGVGVASEQASPGGITLAGTSSGGVKYGIGGGCAAGVKFNF